MRILGIVTRTHDSGLALLSDEVPTLVLEEECFNREKHTLRFPFRSLAATFDGQGLDINDIDVITTPWDMKCFNKRAIDLSPKNKKWEFNRNWIWSPDQERRFDSAFKGHLTSSCFCQRLGQE